MFALILPGSRFLGSGIILLFQQVESSYVHIYTKIYADENLEEVVVVEQHPTWNSDWLIHGIFMNRNRLAI